MVNEHYICAECNYELQGSEPNNSDYDGRCLGFGQIKCEHCGAECIGDIYIAQVDNRHGHCDGHCG